MKHSHCVVKEFSLIDILKLEIPTMLGKKPFTVVQPWDIRAFFGVSLRALIICWKICSFPKWTTISKFLWYCMFLKTYKTEAVLSSIAGMTPKTYRETVWPIINKNASKTENVVSSWLFYCYIVVYCLYYLWNKSNNPSLF